MAVQLRKFLLCGKLLAAPPGLGEIPRSPLGTKWRKSLLEPALPMGNFSTPGARSMCLYRERTSSPKAT